MKILSVVLTSIFIWGCTKNSAPSSNVTAEESVEALVSRGQAIYKLNCIACHNVNPSLDGATGPAVQGSSIELLQARVLKGQYPTGYKAKRDTKIMVALPHLEKEISALAAYLNSK